jgi:hypothetical protein
LGSYVTTTGLTNNLANYTTITGLNNNLANYVTATNLTNNLANYQTSAGFNANVAAYLPSYTGVLNTSSISVGNSTVNAQISSATVTLANSTVSLALVLPTSAQKANGQFYYDSVGAWTLLPTQSGSFVTTGTLTQNVDSFLMSAYYGAEYLLSVGDNVANNRYVSKVLITHDGTNAYITEYGSITTNTDVGVFEVAANLTTVSLTFTPVSSNTTVRFSKELIAA